MHTQLEGRRQDFDDGLDTCAHCDCRSFMGIIEGQEQVTCPECGDTYCVVCWESVEGCCEKEDGT